jgi:PAS domain S-box-containing protein
VAVPAIKPFAIQKSVRAIVLLYALVGSVYIIFSDRILSREILHAADVAYFQTIKGLGFIFTTSLGLYFLLDRSVRRTIAVQRRLEETRERYEAFVRNSSEAIWRMEFHQPISIRLEPNEVVRRMINSGFIAECNDAFARMHGRSRAADLIDQPLSIVCHAETFQETICDRLAAGRFQASDFVTETRTPSGAVIILQNRIVPIIDGCKLLRVWITQSDITESRSITHRLEQSEKRLQLVIEGSAAGVWEWDLPGGSLQLSARVFELVRRRPADPLPVPAAYRYVDRRDRAILRENLKRHLETDEPFSVEIRLRRGDGTTGWFLATGKALKENGAAAYMAGSILDITTSKEALAAVERSADELERRVADRTAELEHVSEVAQRASRAKSEFLSRVSHELRTPLNAILGFAQLMELEIEHPSANHRESVEHVLLGARHLLRVINEILDISRIESGHVALVTRTVPVRQIVEESLTLIRPNATAANITIENSTTDAVAVRADEQRLRQILINLLSNAVKYNRPAGRVEVRCERRPHNFARISVTDTGYGISPENQSRLFEPFQRLGAENTKVEGTGLGLALSKLLTIAMGGEIGVDTRLDEGSTFWIELPAAPTGD